MKTNNFKFQCSCCGEFHEEWPAITFKAPDNYSCLSDKDKKQIGHLSSDFCIIKHSDQTDRFIRCVLIQEVNDHCNNLEYGLWVSLSEKSFTDYENNFKKEREETGYFGWLSNKLIEYEFTASIPMDVFTKDKGLRPELIPHSDCNHPFVIDYYNGISKQEAERRISNMFENLKI